MRRLTAAMVVSLGFVACGPDPAAHPSAPASSSAATSDASPTEPSANPIEASSAAPVSEPAPPPKTPPLTDEERAKVWAAFRDALPQGTLSGYVVLPAVAPRFSSAKAARGGTRALQRPPLDASHLYVAEIVKDHGDALEVHGLPHSEKNKDGTYTTLDSSHCVSREPSPLFELKMRFFVRRADLIPVVRAARQTKTGAYEYTIGSGSPVVLQGHEPRVDAAFHAPTAGFDIGLSYAEKKEPPLDRARERLEPFSVSDSVEIFDGPVALRSLFRCTKDKWCSFTSRCSRFFVHVPSAASSVDPPSKGGAEGIAMGVLAHRVLSGATIYWESGAKAGTVQSDVWLFHPEPTFGGSRPSPPSTTKSKSGKTCVPVEPYEERLCFDLCKKGVLCHEPRGLVEE